jgi:hypothetical protein
MESRLRGAHTRVLRDRFGRRHSAAVGDVGQTAGRVFHGEGMKGYNGRMSLPSRKIFRCLLMAAGWMLVPALAFAGIISEKKLAQVSIGASAEKIVSVLGKPDLRRAEGVDGQGRAMERLQYTMVRRLKDPLPNGDLEVKYPCSLMLADGALVRVERQI